MLSVDELELGVLLDELELGVELSVVEPAPAVPPLVEDELDGLVDEVEPPLDWSFFWMSTEVDEELEPEGGVVVLVLGEPAAEDDEEPEGEVLGEAVVPLADDEELGAVLGEVVEPDGAVVVEELEDAFSPRSHPASTAAPNAKETASANVENLMGPPWLGYAVQSARIGPRMLRSYRRRTTRARSFT